MKFNKMLTFLAVLAMPYSAMAGPITYNFLNGNLSASVQFAKSGSNLIVTLTNTSTADALVPTDILGGLFFDVVGNPGLHPGSAVVPLGHSVLVGGTGADVTPGNRVVGGEWAYLNGLNQVPPNNSGISSVGLGIFGPGNLFPGPDLQGPPSGSPDGIQFGITSAVDNLLTGNGALSGQALIRSSVVFTLAGFSSEPSDSILGATFQYGTSLDEPRYVGQTPEPSSAVLALLGIGILSVLRWRHRSGCSVSP